ncbi:MAG: hypothetical protein EBY32_13055 [Proteobacteria bacterium]|nr:hypothetical protein [Pseudomonadota bacterium]
MTTTERWGRREVEQPKAGPVGARRAGASESKDTEDTEWLNVLRAGSGRNDSATLLRCAGSGLGKPGSTQPRRRVLPLAVGEFSAQGVVARTTEWPPEARHEGVGKARAALRLPGVVQRTVRGEFLARGSGRKIPWGRAVWNSSGVG